LLSRLDENQCIPEPLIRNVPPRDRDSPGNFGEDFPILLLIRHSRRSGVTLMGLLDYPRETIVKIILLSSRPVKGKIAPITPSLPIKGKWLL
jgi:hypothetical protein